MSPLLEISLFVVVLFWIVPLSWAVYSFVRSIPNRTMALVSSIYSLPSTLRRIRLKAHFHREQFQLKQKHLHLEIDYRKAEESLKAQREAVADALLLRDQLFYDLQKIRQAVDELNAKAADRTIDDAERRKLSNLAMELTRLSAEFVNKDAELSIFRDGLVALEAEVQKKYTQKQVQIALDKADAAEQAVIRILAQKPNYSPAMTRMEISVCQKEAAIYGKFFHEDQYVSFPGVAKILERLAIEKLDFAELNDLFDAVELSANELCRILHSAVSYERILSLQAEDAEDPSQFDSIIDASKICSQEFTRLHGLFTEKEREIFERISALRSSLSEEAGA